MDVLTGSEQKVIPSQKYQLKADKIGKIIPTPNPRRQDKMIAALMRNDSSLLLKDSVVVTTQERQSYIDRYANTRLDHWRDIDIEQALSALPLPTMQEENIRQPVKTFKRFEGNETLQRRMRRVVSLVTRGTPATPDVVNPYDLYNFVKNKCRNAVAFERKIPEILQEIDKADLGSDNYIDALHEVGISLFGSQWVYLQQIRRVESDLTVQLPMNREKDKRNRTFAVSAEKGLVKIIMTNQSNTNMQLPEESFQTKGTIDDTIAMYKELLDYRKRNQLVIKSIDMSDSELQNVTAQLEIVRIALTAKIDVLLVNNPSQREKLLTPEYDLLLTQSILKPKTLPDVPYFIEGQAGNRSMLPMMPFGRGVFPATDKIVLHDGNFFGWKARWAIRKIVSVEDSGNEIVSFDRDEWIFKQGIFNDALTYP